MSLNRRVLITALTILVLVSSWIVDAAYASRSANYLRVKDLSPGRILLIRAGPARSFEAIGFLPFKARHIRNYGCKRFATGRWCELRYRGIRGWASERYLVEDKMRRA